MPKMPFLFVFGLGYSGQAIARLALSRGWRVAGTVRSPEKADRLKAHGVDATVFDGKSPSAPVHEALRHADLVVQSIAPSSEGDPVLRLHGPDLAAAKWIGYLSTVGVYGNHDGAWVDETTICRPVSERSRFRVHAEEDWLSRGSKTRTPVACLRLSGIYGPGRSAFDKLRAGTARRIVKPGQVFNRIFVDDIATATLAAAEARFDGVLNVTDDEPAPPQDVVAFAARIIGADPPPEVAFEDAPLSPMGRSFYGESKRVRNGVLRDRLGVTLQAPTYREGLRHILAQEVG